MKEYIEREALILNFESRYMDYRQRSETPIGGGRVAVDKDLQTAANPTHLLPSRLERKHLLSPLGSAL